jgi:hypothetical protein
VSNLLDPFNFFRWLFFLFVSIYFCVTTFQFLWSWYVWLWQPDRYMTMLRNYVILHGLRLRVRAFWGDAIICVLLATAFVLLWRAHFVLEATTRAMR